MEKREMPRPGVEHERIGRLAGQWAGEEKMMASPQNPETFHTVARVNARMALGGFYLLVDYEQERDGQVIYRGHGVIGWDPKAGHYTQSWFDSMGGHSAVPATGPWEGDTLRLTHESRDHGCTRYLYVLGDGGYRMRIETSPDGHAWSPFLDGRYHKR